MKTQSTTRPMLNQKLNSLTFKNFYYEKKELIAFCLQNNIPSQGSKLDLSERIAHFLDTGKIQNIVKPKRVGIWDSAHIISASTKVVNYRNDAKTKEFFVSQIGNKFKFNEYLRQFAKKTDMDGSLTYADLVKGWLQSESDKKSAACKAPIAKQFQFNQFQRDFYSAEKSKTRKEFLDAWKLVKSFPGPATYEHYIKIIKELGNE